ncbi:MAG: HlyD family efflux transporter periplasmic adaptor subunit [Rhodocyclaceae bacterium]|nr:HlyD family efflux transporter periplasmic adaptor subunit [Rhodocyclaceae bacterium]
MRHRIIPTTLMFLCTVAFAHGDEDHSKDDKKSPAPVATLLTVHHAAQRLVDGSLFVPKSVQRQLAIRTQPVQLGDLNAVVELNGKVIPNPDTGGRVQATHSGSVLPGSKGMPLPGRKVRRGEVLAYLRPIGTAIERGNQQAQLAELEAQIAIAAAKLKRFDQLEGIVPQKEIESAHIDYAALQKRRGFVSASVNTAEPLVAPVSGVIGASNVVAGQVVEAKEILFEIIDPAHLAVEALAYEASLASSIVAASALTTDGIALDLKFIGGGQQLREQALPLLFRITTGTAAIAVGQPVKVMLRTARGIRGAAVARSALTGRSGEEILWVHTEAERFVARKVRVQSLDAANVAILEGLRDGERVVTEGASLLSQIR